MRLIRVYLNFFFRYLRFYSAAVTEYDIDSPYIYRFLREVVLDNRFYAAFRRIESLRASLKNSQSMLSVKDLGAGSQVHFNNRRRVAALVRVAAVSPAQGQLLFKTALWTTPRGILELGSSLGISAAYLGLADSRTRMLSIEGCPQTARQARLNLDAVGAGQVEIRVGSFAEQLSGALETLKYVDLLHLDGDHRKEPVMHYVSTCLSKAGPNAVFIIGDIHWSEEMEAAWAALQQLPEVRGSLDLFHFGILFFNPDLLVRRHYAFVPWRYKPWRLGIFR